MQDILHGGWNFKGKLSVGIVLAETTSSRAPSSASKTRRELRGLPASKSAGSTTLESSPIEGHHQGLPGF
ncbi:MAG: hypothetical protein R2751_10325 [Bacteroidales bacterium]